MGYGKKLEWRSNYESSLLKMNYQLKQIRFTGSQTPTSTGDKLNIPTETFTGSDTPASTGLQSSFPANDEKLPAPSEAGR